MGEKAQEAASSDAQSVALRRLTRILPAQLPVLSGWARHFVRIVWRIVVPWLQKQEEFNAAVAEDVNRARQLHAEVAVLRETIGVLQRASHMLTRELERLSESARPPSAGLAASAGTPPTTAMAPAPVSAPFSSLDSYKYVGFEDQFRGSTEEIRARLAAYVPDFAGASDVLDIGCGRGEFLDLLREHGIRARGLDINHEMVELTRSRGLDVTEADALSYLSGIPDGSLGGLFAAQVVEHLDSTYLMRLLETARRKLRPGARIILETINPACWLAFFSSYIRDFTHVRPVHPDTLQFLLIANGFERVTTRYLMPVPDHMKLRLVPAATRDDDLAGAFNANAALLNSLLFTHLDYAAVGERG